MKLGIISDTHDQIERTERSICLLRDAKAEVLVHCGDITGTEIVRICSAFPCHYVLGNNDSDISGLTKSIAEAGGWCLMWGGEVVLADRRIAVTHGHRPSELKNLIAAKPDYLLTGHSHIAMDQQVNSTRRINPGALHRANHFSVALLDLNTDELDFLPVSR
jgi:putative phosphoesterase